MKDATFMTCREVNEFLMDYLSGALGRRVRERFEKHLAACPPCFTYLRQYRDTIHLGQESLRGPEAEPPLELVRAILAARQARR